MASRIIRRERSLPKGLFAGLLGGIVGAAAMLVAEEIYPPRTSGNPAEHAALIGGEQATYPATTSPGRQARHWALGAAAGGLYGMAAEVEPSLAAWRGAAFGITLNRITQDSRLPRMGVARSEDTPSARISAWIGHAAYGIATDSMRRIVRRFL